MVAFGHLMLPVVGIIAIGLLVVGVKLFFLVPPPEEPSAISMAMPTVSPTPSSSLQAALPDLRPSEDHSSALSGNIKEPGRIVAVPLGTFSGTATGLKKPEERLLTPTPRVLIGGKTLSGTLSADTTRSVAEARWGIQIGAFTERLQADHLKEQALRQGYLVVVTEAHIKGKMYYRVRVVGGKNRSDAETLRGKLQQQGYPTILVRL